MMASKCGKEDCVVLLLGANAGVDVKDDRGTTALMWASIRIRASYFSTTALHLMPLIIVAGPRLTTLTMQSHTSCVPVCLHLPLARMGVGSITGKVTVIAA
jgi:hypothetical protein